MKRKGFTLIELMVVIMVIAILVGIAIPRIGGMQDEANLRKAEAELRTLQTAVESFYINQTPRAYPGTTTAICQDELNNTTPAIITEVLYDPFDANGAEYNYIKSSNGKYYVLFSVGLDGEADITGISTAGLLQGSNNDDPYATNGTAWVDLNE